MEPFINTKSYQKAFTAIFSLCFLLLCSSSLHAENNQKSFTYRLGAGDKLSVHVFNQDELTGEYTLNGEGTISMPLIGRINAKNKTVKELEEDLINTLKPDFLVNPRVNIQVLNYRPFYILGEINNPDSYPYVDGMTYLNAIAIAGGYTYRAKEDYVYVVHTNTPHKEEIKISTDMPVMPGDVIRVDERMF